uniref:Uncharacterized protein n=1 Tax=Clytia hemisphaerica TaxID=252671 RepID=A0A7M5XIQ1_9CNID
MEKKAGDVKIAIVDQHQEVIPHWYQAIKDGKIASSTNTLIHFDGHSDMATPENYEIIEQTLMQPNEKRHKSKSYLLPLMQANDRFITSAVLTGLIDRVIWVQPDWLRKDTVEIQVGYIGETTNVQDPEKSKTACMCVKEIRKLKKQREHKETHRKEELACFYLTEALHNQTQMVPQKSCHKVHPLKYFVFSERNFMRYFRSRSLKPGHVFIDIDEDYFGVEGGVQKMIDGGIPMDVIYITDEVIPQIYCPNSIMAEKGLNTALQNMFHELYLSDKRSESLIEDVVMKHTKKYFCEKQDNTFVHLFISYIQTQSTKQVLKALSSTKYCLFNSLQLRDELLGTKNDFALCHGTIFPNDTLNKIYVDSKTGIETRRDNLSKMLDFIYASTQPRLITIARSLRDGYVPREQQRFIERNVRKAVDQTLRKVKMTSETIFDENLVFGEKGWV